jgi:hypothetical protein
MGEHKNGAYSKHRYAGQPAPDARAVLVRYLENIFPNETADRLVHVADHQIDWLKREGFRIVPFVATDV